MAEDRSRRPAVATERGEVDALLPRWLFPIRARWARMSLAIAVPIALSLPYSVVEHAAALRAGPVFALALIFVAALAGSNAAVVAGALSVLVYWSEEIPPASSFALSTRYDAAALGGMLLFAAVLPLLARQMEGTAADLRALDVRRRRRSQEESEARREAERLAAHLQAALALSNALAEVESMSEVAERFLDHVDIPATPSTGSVAIVQGNRLKVLAARGATAESLQALEQVDLATSPWLGQVLRGRPAFVDDRDTFAAQYPEARVLRMYPSGSWLVLPFRSENTVGLLSLHYLQPQQLSTHSVYFSLVAELLSAAIERARAQQRQRQQHALLQRAFAERDRIARTLSTTLLPPKLPTLPGFSMAGWVVPSSSDQVAGDFYDVFAVDEGGWVAVLGDVCGKGAEAAAVTSLARYATRASALDQPDPLHIAAVANRALEQDPSDLFCTMALVRYVPTVAEIQVVLAGHLQVRIVRAGEVVRAGHYASPLGLMRTEPQLDRRGFLPGDSLVLFSDGLVERNPGFGEDQLDALLLELASQPAPDLAAEVRRRVIDLAPHRQDDLALLVVSRH